MEPQEHKPFAITARKMGAIKRPFTRVLLANFHSRDKVSAAYVNALWDTGAATSLMSAKLAAQLGYEFTEEGTWRGIGKAENKALFGYAYVSLVSNGDSIETLTAIVDDDLGDDYSFIIGMDLISKGSFALTCTKFETTLSFTIPAAPAIDFTKLLAKLHLDTGEIPLGITEPENYKYKVYHGIEALRLICPGQDRPTTEK